MNKKNVLVSSALACMILSSIPLTTVCASVTRNYAGSSRFDTAIKISQSLGSKADKVILASANNDNLVDALTAAPLAKKIGAPILFTSSDSLDKATLNRIKGLGAKTVYLTSGEGVIGKGVEDELKSIGVTSIIRLGGGNRYETSINIASEMENINKAMKKGTINKVMIARGDNYADALSAAPIAAAEEMPILLSRQEELPEEISSYLKIKNIDISYILGLEGALSSDVQESLKAVTKANEPIRLGGGNRYETNIAIIKEFQDGINFDKVYLACGEEGNLVDALAGAPLAAKTLSPIFLTSSTLPDAVNEYMETNLSKTSSVMVLGGLAGVPKEVSDKVNGTQKDISTVTKKCNGEVQLIKIGNKPLFKTIAIGSTEVLGGAKYRVESSNTIVQIGQPITVFSNTSNLDVYIYSSSDELLAKGSLSVNSNGKKTLNARLVK